MRVGLDCGFRLSALVTRDAWKRLALAPGATAWAMVKATTIQALAATEPSLARRELEGDRGCLDSGACAKPP